MRRLLFLTACLAVALPRAGAAADAALSDAAPSDAGRLIVSLSATVDRESVFHLLCYHSLDGPRRGQIRFEAGFKPVPVWNTLTPQAGTFDEPPVDPATLPAPPGGYGYSLRPLKGAVYVLTLPPGRYVADWLDPQGGCWPKAEGAYGAQLDAAFEIKPRQSVYIGEYSVVFARRRTVSLFTNVWADQHLAVAIRDRHDRDLGIAAAKYPELGPVELAVPGRH